MMCEACFNSRVSTIITSPYHLKLYFKHIQKFKVIPSLLNTIYEILWIVEIKGKYKHVIILLYSPTSIAEEKNSNFFFNVIIIQQELNY